MPTFWCIRIISAEQKFADFQNTRLRTTASKNHVWILAIGVQTVRKKNAEEVLVGKLQKVLELLNRIIFSAVSEIRAYYIMYLQDWGKN